MTVTDLEEPALTNCTIHREGKKTRRRKLERVPLLCVIYLCVSMNVATS